MVAVIYFTYLGGTYIVGKCLKNVLNGIKEQLDELLLTSILYNTQYISYRRTV